MTEDEQIKIGASLIAEKRGDLSYVYDESMEWDSVTRADAALIEAIAKLDGADKFLCDLKNYWVEYGHRRGSSDVQSAVRNALGL